MKEDTVAPQKKFKKKKKIEINPKNAISVTNISRDCDIAYFLFECVKCFRHWMRLMFYA